MNIYKKLSFWIAVSLIGGCFTDLISCETSPSHTSWSKTLKGELKNRAKEEEINYFFATGSYRISTGALKRHIEFIDDHIEDLDKYPDYPKGLEGYIDPEYLDKNNVVDTKGNIVDIRPLLKLVATEYGPMFTGVKNINLEEYKIIEEYYSVRTTFYHKFYCKQKVPRAIPEDLIFDDNLVIRLYDKNDKIIDEYKMRNEVNFEDYKRDPVSQYNKVGSWGGGKARLIGMLKLPPKNKRKGLKYRVLRLDKQGKPLVHYRSPLENKPHQYYIFEETLPPYSEYKYWDYSSGGCYSAGGGPSKDSLDKYN